METGQIFWEEDTRDQGVQAGLGQKVVRAGAPEHCWELAKALILAPGNAANRAGRTGESQGIVGWRAGCAGPAFRRDVRARLQPNRAQKRADETDLVRGRRAAPASRRPDPKPGGNSQGVRAA